jgi:hypothetical protein
MNQLSRASEEISMQNCSGGRAATLVSNAFCIRNSERCIILRASSPHPVGVSFAPPAFTGFAFPVGTTFVLHHAYLWSGAK